MSQTRRFQGNSVWGSTVGQTKRRFQTLQVERFPEGTAEPRMVQLHGGGASTITEAICPYGGTRPLLMQPAIAKATRYNRVTLPQGIAHGSRVETAAAGQSLQQQGEPHNSRAEPGEANSD